MSNLFYLRQFLARQNIENFTRAELSELESIILDAIDAELYFPRLACCQLQISTGADSDLLHAKVLELLEQNGFRLVSDHYNLYLKWQNGLLTG